MELLTVNETAKFLKTKPHTIRNWITRKTIPEELIKRKFGKIYFIKSEIENYILSAC